MQEGIVRHTGVAPPWSAVGFTSVVEMAEIGCSRWLDRPAIIFEDGLQITRHELLNRSLRFAVSLISQAAPGSRIAIMLENRVETMVAFLGTMMAGCVAVAINPASRKHDAAHVLRDSASVILVTSEILMPLVESIRGECPLLAKVFAVSQPEPEGLEPFSTHGKLENRTRPGMKDLAAIYYTSGTTGLPKGCVLDHEWWLRLCDIHLRLAKPQADYRPLCCLPFHNADSMSQMLCALHCGGTLVAMRRFSVTKFWQVVADRHCTELFLLASMPILLLKQHPSVPERAHRLRTVVCAAVPREFHHDLNQRFGVQFLDSYGSTEAGWVTRMPLEHAENMIGSGSIGVPVPDMELRVVDDDGKDVPQGMEGELLIRGPGLFIEYLNNIEATAEAMKGGWYHSGDIVRADERGFYYFLGRNRDVIRRSGANIAAAEIEAVLRRHPAVVDAAAVPAPDALRGEELKVYVLLRQPPSQDAESQLQRQVLRHCAEHLAPFKVPRYIVLCSGDFPRTPTMRVLKSELQTAFGLHRIWDREADQWLEAKNE